MSFDLNGARADLADKLEAAGIKTTLDPRNVNPPITVIGLPVITEWNTACILSLDIEITPVAPPPGNLDAVTWLLDTVAQLLDLFPHALATPSSFDVTNQPNPLPAYTLVVSTQVKE